jgi:signal transduction histidine kinase
MFFAQRSRAIFRRLSTRLTLWHSLIVLGSMLAMSAVTYVLLRRGAGAAERDAIDFRINQYAGEYHRNGLAGVRRLAALRKGRAQKAFFVRVGNGERTLFMRDRADWTEFEPERLASRPVPPAGARVWERLASPAGTELLLASMRLNDGSVLQLGKPNDDLLEVLASYRRSAIWLALIFVPASFAGGAFLASRALRPVQQLRAVAQDITDTGQFGARVPPRNSGDELDLLVQVFNTMLARIDQLVRGMRETVDNVAHDLKTPLMRLSQKAQTLIEANQRQLVRGECPNCAAAIDALGDCVEESDRVAAMLDTLMDIAETEAGAANVELQPVPVAGILEETVSDYREFAEHQGIRVTIHCPESLPVLGDHARLSRVFANVLDNAIKYNRPGGKVEITAEQSGSMVEIAFADTGAGISAEDLPRIWQRLFRGDRSRSERGMGLGLSFVRAIVEAHGGTATAQSEAGAGTTITIRLRSAPGSPGTPAEQSTPAREAVIG